MPEETKGLRGRSRRKLKNGQKTALICAGTALCLILAGGGIYAGMGQKYSQVFFPNTVINGLDAGGLTAEQVKELIDAGITDYVLTLETRDGQEQISGASIHLRTEYDGTLERLLEEQNPLFWGKYLSSGPEYTIETMIAYDKELFEAEMGKLHCLAAGKQAPVDACLSGYVPGSGYQIVSEQPGNTADPERVRAAVADAIINRKQQISLDEQDVYRKPEVTAEDPALIARAEEWNRYVNTVVTYKFGSSRERLDGSTIHTWLSDNGQGSPVLNEEAVGEYVASLAKKYNTAYRPKQLKTSYGPVVTISQGFYGWRINQGAEKSALLQILNSGESQEREPVYAQTAASRDGNDYGDTYVEINLTAQHLFFYKDGTLLTEADFVSGNSSRGWTTPPGAFPLTYKERNATLRGENYATPVNYWMPFNGNIGMHDAGWRSSFGGTIYKTNGSHGCINLPPSAAKKIYENISAGMPVLCYNLEGTERGSAGAPMPETTAPVETTAAAEATTAASQETTAAAEATTAASQETTAAAEATTAASRETAATAEATTAVPQETTEAAAETSPAPTETAAEAPQESAAGPGAKPEPETSASQSGGPVRGSGKPAETKHQSGVVSAPGA